MDEHPGRDGRDEPDPYDDELGVERYEGDDQAEDYEDEDYQEEPYEDEGYADEAYASRPLIASVPAFFLGILAGALALGIVWAFVGVVGGNDAQAGTPRHQPRTVVTVLGTQQARPDSAPALLARCRRAWDSQSQPLRAAAATLDQWEVHVGAMNKLVVGAITLQQANAFWNQTRVGASKRLVRFLAAEQQAAGPVAACPRHPADASPPLQECARAVAARARTLGAADVAAHTWQHHVRDMEMLRMGDLSPAEASRMWLASWHRGMQQLHAYRDAVRNDTGTGC